MGLNASGFGFQLYTTGASGVVDDFGRVGRAANEMGSAQAGVARGAGAAAGGFGMMKMGALGAAVAVGAVATKAITMTAAFEQSIANLAAIGGAWQLPAAEARETMEKLEGAARKLGATTQYSATEAAEAMTILAQAGFSTAEVLDTKLTPSVLMLAQAGGTDLATAADTMAVSLKAMKLEAEDAGRVTNVLAQAAVEGRVDVKDMVTSLGYAGGPASLFGLSIEQVGGAMAKMSNAGLDASTVGTSMRSVFTRLASPTKGVHLALESIGMSAKGLTDESTGKFRDFNEIIMEMSDGFKSLPTDADRASFVAAIGGQAGMVGFQALIEGSGAVDRSLLEMNARIYGAGVNVGGLSDALDGKLSVPLRRAAEEAGFTTDRLAKMNSDFTGLSQSLGMTSESLRYGLTASMQTLSNAPKAVQDSLLSVGIAAKDLDGKLRPSGDLIVDLAGKWGTLESSTRESLAASIVGAKNVGAFDAAMTGMAGGSEEAKEQIRALTGEMGDLSAVIGGAGNAMASLQSDTLTGDWKNLESAGEELGLVMFRDSGLTNVFRVAVQFLSEAINSMSAWLKKATAGFRDMSGSIGVVAALKSVFQALGQVVGTVFSIIGHALSSIWRVVSGFFQKIGSAVASATASTGGFAASFGGILTSIKNVINAVIDVIMSMVGVVLDFFAGIFEGFMSFWEPISAIFNQIMEKVSRIGRRISDAFKSLGPEVQGVGNIIGEVLGFVVTTVGWVINVIVMLIEGLIFGILNIGTIFTAVGNTIFDFFTFLGAMIAGAVMQLATWGLMGITTVVMFVEGALGLFLYLWDNLMAGLGAFGNFFIDIWNFLAEGVIVPVINFFIGAFNMFAEGAYAVFNAVGSAFQSVWNFMAENVLVPVINFMIDAVNVVGEAFAAVWHGIQVAFFAVAGTIVSGVESLINSVIEAINVLVEGISWISDLLGLGEISAIGEVSLGGADLLADASKEFVYEPVVKPITAADLGVGEWKDSVFNAVEPLSSSALNITDRFNETGATWAEAQSKAAGALGSADLLAAAESMQEQSNSLFETPVMQPGRWDAVSDAWNSVSQKQEDTAVTEDKKEDKKKDAKKTEKAEGKGGGGAPVDPSAVPPEGSDAVNGAKTADALDGIERQNRESARQASRGVKIANPEDIKTEVGDTNITLNQSIDTEKKREQFVLDQGIRTFATVVG